MRCLCIGICQLSALVKVLKTMPSFTTIFDTIIEVVIFQVSPDKMTEILQDSVPTMDLVISQPVSRNYRDNDIFSSKTLRDRCLELGVPHIMLTNCYFSGYDPLPFQTTNLKGDILPILGCSYFPGHCLNAFINNNTFEALRLWQGYEYTLEVVEKNLDITLSELRRREKSVFDEDFGVDVSILDFIENNFRNTYLFHTYNHPTNALLQELLKRLLDKIGTIFIDLPSFDDYLSSSVWNKELLGNDSIPPCPQIMKCLNCTFKTPNFILANHVKNAPEALYYCTELLCKMDDELKKKWINYIEVKKDILKIKN